MTTFYNWVTLLVAMGYVAVCIILWHKVALRIRFANWWHALAIWLLATGTGWFGVLLFFETIRYGFQPEMRLAGHILFQASIWMLLYFHKPIVKGGGA